MTKAVLGIIGGSGIYNLPGVGPQRLKFSLATIYIIVYT
jgi:purine nucleoside phosphorylase